MEAVSSTLTPISGCGQLQLSARSPTGYVIARIRDGDASRQLPAAPNQVERSSASSVVHLLNFREQRERDGTTRSTASVTGHAVTAAAVAAKASCYCWRSTLGAGQGRIQRRRDIASAASHCGASLPRITPRYLQGRHPRHLQFLELALPQ
jgi:hypothetical protein